MNDIHRRFTVYARFSHDEHCETPATRRVSSVRSRSIFSLVSDGDAQANKTWPREAYLGRTGRELAQAHRLVRRPQKVGQRSGWTGRAGLVVAWLIQRPAAAETAADTINFTHASALFSQRTKNNTFDERIGYLMINVQLCHKLPRENWPQLAIPFSHITLKMQRYDHRRLTSLRNCHQLTRR